jgi:hypothetical protein
MTSHRDIRLTDGFTCDVTSCWRNHSGFALNCLCWCSHHISHAWNCTSGSDPQGGRDIMTIIFEHQEDLVWFRLGFLEAHYGD